MGKSHLEKSDGAIFYKTVLFSNEEAELDGVFVHDKPLKPSPMFVSKVWAHPSEIPFWCSILGSWLSPKTSDSTIVRERERDRKIEPGTETEKFL